MEEPVNDREPRGGWLSRVQERMLRAMNLSHAFRQVVDNAKSFGTYAAIHDLQQRAVNRVVPFQILKGMTAVLPDINPGLFETGGFVARFATKGELLDKATPEYEMTREMIEAALHKGDQCFAIFDGDRLASFGWYSNQPTNISEELVLHFDPAWVYMYKGFTHPDYRGKRLHGIGMSLALRSYTDGGSRGLISYVNSNNFQSLRSIERMGYRIFGDIYLARLLGRPVTWATPGCKPYGFRLESVAARASVAATS
jgi:hypothetical protein